MNGRDPEQTSELDVFQAPHSSPAGRQRPHTHRGQHLYDRLNEAGVYHRLDLVLVASCDVGDSPGRFLHRSTPWIQRLLVDAGWNNP